MILLYILIAFAILYTPIIILKKRYGNPYQLIFLFGKKGAGKSCYLIHEIKKHLKRGWIVYSDLHTNIKGVRHISAEDLKEFKPVENSLICLDEVGLTWSNRDFKNFDKKLTEFFKLQRHFRCKVIMNSQSFDVDKKIRDVTDSMILQSNLFNCISISRPIIRRVTLVEASAEGESRIADNLEFAKIWHWRLYWMPKYFKYFDSFSIPDRPELPYNECNFQAVRDDARHARFFLNLHARRRRE